MVVWVLSGLLAALFVFGGVPKIYGAADMAQHFREWGYPDWFRILIGLIEVGGGIGLLVPSLAAYAATALGVVMIGAAFTILRAGAPGLPIPLVCLALLTVVAYLRRPLAH